MSSDTKNSTATWPGWAAIVGPQVTASWRGFLAVNAIVPEDIKTVINGLLVDGIDLDHIWSAANLSLAIDHDVVTATRPPRDFLAETAALQWLEEFNHEVAQGRLDRASAALGGDGLTV